MPGKHVQERGFEVVPEGEGKVRGDLQHCEVRVYLYNFVKFFFYCVLNGLGLVYFLCLFQRSSLKGSSMEVIDKNNSIKLSCNTVRKVKINF